MRTLTAGLCWALVLTCLAFAEKGEVIVPVGCVAVQDAGGGHGGYANRVIHEKTGIELVLIAPGSFDMGGEGGLHASSCAPVHRVTFGHAFYMSRTEVTNGQYKRFAATGYRGEKDVDPAYDLYLRHLRGKSVMPKEDDYPVVWISWKNAKAFCDWAGLDLPSEAEWEYTCRAGTTTTFGFGNDVKDLDKYAWTVRNSQAATHPVAQLLPNGWGLFDMLGNASEWTLDDYISSYEGAPADGSARIDGRMTKVLRGVPWSGSAAPTIAGCSMRFNSAPVNASNYMGFRVVMRRT